MRYSFLLELLYPLAGWLVGYVLGRWSRRWDRLVWLEEEPPEGKV
jgi:hypothetical protein